MKTAEEIVRALAGGEEPIHETITHGDTCRLCAAPVISGAAGESSRVEHTDACPYRMAREWVEAQDQGRVIAERELDRLMAKHGADLLGEPIVVEIGPEETLEQVAARFPGVLKMTTDGLAVRRGKSVRLVAKPSS